MGVNDFKTFATDGTVSYLESVADYANDTVRKNGNIPGPASASILNRAWRQGANMASAVGDAVIRATPLNALDDGNLTVLRDAILATINTARVPRSAVFKNGGATSWVVPAGVYRVRIRAWGAGGGGGGSQGAGAAGGGGGGPYMEIDYDVVPGKTFTFTVPAGGTAGSSSGGSVGANTGGAAADLELFYDTIYDVLALAGGQGGVGSFGGTFGSGGPGGDPSTSGTSNLEVFGGRGYAAYGGTPVRGGNGGNGGNGGSGGVPGTTMSAGAFPSGGGAGGSGTQAGTNGGDGLLIFDY